MPSCAWHLYGCTQVSGPPCLWLAGEAMPRSPSGPPVHWTGGWPRPPCLARPLSWPSCSSVSFYPQASLFSHTLWSSSKSSPLQKRFPTMMLALETATTWRWNSQRWVRVWSKVVGRTKDELQDKANRNKKTFNVKDPSLMSLYVYSFSRWQCWFVQASW